MQGFSANLGFLWTELSLPDAVRKARAAGFGAVECHWPYAVPAEELRAVLEETGLPLLGLNTRKGDREGDFGLAALPEREEEARAAIDEAVAYAAAVGARAVHVMAGRVAEDEAAEAAFAANLAHACKAAEPHGITILIEPINHHDVPGYFLSRVEQAAAIIRRVGTSNLKIMFDCYHTQIMQGDLVRRFAAHGDLIGHVQIAAVPSRAEPDEGEICFERLLPAMRAGGYEGFFGAEYKPRAGTDEGLGWARALANT
ncbi:MAG: TIM barrel protein [Nitratireductor sp.]|uniref:hydroxypyruvate isomerase family protein n=1 Tax=Nitratireductor sp. TaxID=1872084 RepID=UPI0026320CA6|nr:TIM barrel protein [Nitratireductor sp.]MCV0349470.1 TIM barrel protein [Nitratireductor sp.]